MARQQRLQGLVVGSRQHQLDMVRALDVVGVRPIIDRTFTFPELADAFRLQQTASHLGKIVVEY